VVAVHEPTVVATIVTPAEFVGPLMLLCQERRGEMTEHAALGAGRALLKCGSDGVSIRGL
jgi:GTP-binding protein LepA